MAPFLTSVDTLTLGPFSVQIRVDKKALTLYKSSEDVDESHCGTRYLEGLPGRVFDIKIDRGLEGRSDRKEAADCDITLDGESYALLGEYLPSGWTQLTRRSYLIPSSTTNKFERVKPCFADIAAVGHNESMKAVDVSPHFGTIRIGITRGTLLERPKKKTSFSPDASAQLPIDEKSLKGQEIDQTISSVSNGLKRGMSSFIQCDDLFTPYPGEKGEEFVFTFKYRSRKTLQRLGLIALEKKSMEPEKTPRAPSPSPEPAIRSGDPLLQALKLIVTAFEKTGKDDGRKAVKRERDDDDDLGSERRPRKPKHREMTIVDLTVD